MTNLLPRKQGWNFGKITLDRCEFTCMVPGTAVEGSSYAVAMTKSLWRPRSIDALQRLKHFFAVRHRSRLTSCRFVISRSLDLRSNVRVPGIEDGAEVFLITITRFLVESERLTFGWNNA
jgi:hypothetical protein